MTTEIRSNTATRITVGPFLDKTDGVTPEIALTVTSCLLTFIADTGGVPTLVIDAAPTASGGNNDMVHITSDAAGYYDLELTAAQTNYLGRAKLAITDAATHCPVFHEIMILNTAIYDAKYASSGGAIPNVAAGSTGGFPVIGTGTNTFKSDSSANITFANTSIATVTNLTNLPAITAGWLTAAGIAASALDGKGNWNIGKTGYSLTVAPLTAAQVNAEVDTALADYDAPTKAELDAGFAALNDPTAAAIADAVWDEVLTAATHNVATSAGRRLRTLQTGGNYEGGMVWIDTNNGTAGTTLDENGVVNLPVDTLADALTIAAAGGFSMFHVANGSSITLTATSDNYVFQGHEYNLALGGQSVASMTTIDAKVSGTGTGTESEYEQCIFGITSLPAMQAYDCSFTATTSGGFTMSAAGDYRFINCQSGVPGSGAPLFTLGTGAISVEWRRWSGGIQIAGISSDDVMTISGELGTVTLNGADGTVEIRGTYKAIVDNRTGSPTLNVAGALNEASIVDATWDEATSGHATAGTTGKALTDAGSAGDPWSTALPGAYGAGTAGKIVGDNLNATVSSRMATTHINATAGKVDGVALVDTTTTNTDMRGTDSAATATNLATVDTVVDAIKVKTDQLVFTKANELDSNIQSVNGVALTGDGSATPFDVV